MEDTVDSGTGCRTGLSAYVAWRANTTTLCRSTLSTPVSDYEFGYSASKQYILFFIVGHFYTPGSGSSRPKRIRAYPDPDSPHCLLRVMPRTEVPNVYK
jgi:hypothetical protein